CEKERRRRWPKSPEHRGERAIIRKTIAWGMPGDSGVTCMLVCALLLHCTRDRGRIGRPAFPAPSIRRGREINEHLAQKACGEIAKLRRRAGRATLAAFKTRNTSVEGAKRCSADAVSSL